MTISFALPPAWVIAVAVSISVSFCTVCGFALQAIALRTAMRETAMGLKPKWPTIGELVLSPVWICGSLLQAVPNVCGDFIAYALAPLSLTAPLSGVSVILNTSVAPKLLGEKLQYWPDLPATVLILCGTVMTTITGSHTDTAINGIEDLERLALRPVARVAVAGVVASLVICLLLQVFDRMATEKESSARFDNPKVSKLVLPAYLAAGTGGLTNIGLKSFAELTKTGMHMSSLAIVFVALVFTPAMGQVQAINRGLRLYPQTVFFPVYSSLLVFANTFFGIFFFQEGEGMLGSTDISLFVLGIVLITIGISMYSLRTDKAGALATTADSKAPLLRQGASDTVSDTA